MRTVLEDVDSVIASAWYKAWARRPDRLQLRSFIR